MANLANQFRAEHEAPQDCPCGQSGGGQGTVTKFGQNHKAGDRGPAELFEIVQYLLLFGIGWDCWVVVLESCCRFQHWLGGGAGKGPTAVENERTCLFLVMNTGVPWGVFGCPVPVPAEFPSRSHGCGIPAEFPRA